VTALNALKGGEEFNASLNQKGWTVQNVMTGDDLADRSLTTLEVMSVMGSSFWIADLEDEKVAGKKQARARAKDHKKVV